MTLEEKIGEVERLEALLKERGIRVLIDHCWQEEWPHYPVDLYLSVYRSAVAPKGRSHSTEPAP